MDHVFSGSHTTGFVSLFLKGSESVRESFSCRETPGRVTSWNVPSISGIFRDPQ